MTSRNRLLVFAVSTPVIVFALVGGYLGQTMTREEVYQPLRVFEDVVSLVLNNYVEEVDVEDAMRGAMNGLADGLDADSAYLTPDVVTALESGAPAGEAGVGIELSRQYYLQVVAVRAGSPAADAGLIVGDFVRAIDNRPTRDMSIFEGQRLLRGAPGSAVSLLIIRGNAADPHMVSLTREVNTVPEVSSRTVESGTGYVRIEGFSADTAGSVRAAIDQLSGAGDSRFIIDVRGTSRGDIDDGLATARLFVHDATLALRESKGTEPEVITAGPNDGAITAPLVLLVDYGTGGPAELFAAALHGNGRADLVGQRTLGRAARQRLVKLPDGSGLWLSYEQYLSPEREPIHQAGIQPDVSVSRQVVEFGDPLPDGDAALDRAIEYFAERPAA